MIQIIAYVGRVGDKIWNVLPYNVAKSREQKSGACK